MYVTQLEPHHEAGDTMAGRAVIINSCFVRLRHASGGGGDASASQGAANRGIAHHDGKIFIGTFDGRLVALNAQDGKVLWDVQTTDRE